MSHLLIVEDDDDFREDLGALLAHKGYTVHTAANGAEALAHLRSSPAPCLIVLDLMMPVMNGWQFREHQLGDAQLAEIPVVVVSGVAEDAAALQARQVLTKPVRFQQLLELIGTYCAPAGRLGDAGGAAPG
jgi:CheY-like chemotaxis protein